MIARFVRRAIALQGTVKALARKASVALGVAALSVTPRPASGFSEGQVRPVRDWTPTLIRAAEISADSGNLRQAGELCEAMLGDDRIAGCLLETRVRGLLGLPLSFEAGVGRRRKSVVRALEAEEDWWEAFPEDTLAEWMAWGILLGISVGRLGNGDPSVPGWKDVERKGGNRTIPVLEVIHPSCLRYDHAKKQWFARQDDGSEVLVTPGDGTWIVYTPYGKKRPWARGAWRSLSRWWLLKQYAELDWARYSERHGMGLFVGKAPEGANPKDRDDLASDLESVARDSALALPPGYSLELVESTANTWTTYQAQVNVANSAISIRLLGQNLSSEVTTGSRAAAEVHERVAASIIRADDESSSTTLHDQALVWWAEFNYGDRALAPWPKRDTRPPEDSKGQADTQKAGAEATKLWLDLGAPVDRKQQADRFKVPLLDGAEFTEPVQQQPPAGGFEGLTRRRVGLASGDAAASASGFVRGQAYTDSVAASGRDESVPALSPWIDQVISILDELEDGPDWPERLRSKLAEHLDEGEDLQELLERAMVMAELAGRFAVLEDL